MKAYVLRIQGPKGRYWLVTNDDASIKIKTKRSRFVGLTKLVVKAGQEITSVTRFKGFFRESEAAMTLADIQRESSTA